MCKKCSEVRKAIKNASVVSGAGSHPTTLVLAYMVNLEYYLDISMSCIHEIPEKSGAIISIKNMVDFLDKRNWEVVGRASNKGFKSSSFINRPSKQLVVVHRGTQNWEQIKVDIKLALGLITQDVIKNCDWHTTQSLLNHALKEENRKHVRNDYSVTITGHSLGGWIAQICTLISKYPQFHPTGPRGNFYFGNGTSIDMNMSYDLHCVVFDSLGASAMLDRLELVSKASCLLQGRKRDVQDALNTLDITVYLSNRNVVNMCGSHVGKQVRIDVMSDVSFLASLFASPLISHSMDRILRYFRKISKQ